MHLMAREYRHALRGEGRVRSHSKPVLFRDNMWDIVLVRCGVNLREHFEFKERRKLVSVRYADGRRVAGDAYHCLGRRDCIRDITEEIVRVALEM